jgi:hypothetical protein
MKVVSDNQTLVLPDFLILGAMRSGTTSLYHYLKQHPEIFMPSLKEPHFFSYFGKPVSPLPSYIRSAPWNLEDYLTLFESAMNGQLIGEASVSYLYYYRETIENIKRVYRDNYSQLKCIAILRNPVERAWSLYVLRRQGGWEADFFKFAQQLEMPSHQSDYYNFIRSGMYSEQVKAYRKNFPYIRFFMFEEFKANTDRVVKECLDFLGVDNIVLPGNINKVYNFAGIPKNRLFSPIYDILFRENAFKSLIKPLIPSGIRLKIKTDLGKKIIKKEKIPTDVKKYLRNKFDQDLNLLLTLFDDSHKKKIIKSWIE